MTAQIHDSVLHAGTQYDIAGIKGSGLFVPTDYGLTPEMIDEDCLRGYICSYEVFEGQLYLKGLSIGLNTRPNQQPQLCGKVLKPHFATIDLGHRESTETYRGHTVDGLREPVAFSGGLLLGKTFIHELFVDEGYHPAYAFRKVIELLFESGRLTGQVDRSLALKELRQNDDIPLGPSDPDDPEVVRQWVDQCFRQDYPECLR